MAIKGWIHKYCFEDGALSADAIGRAAMAAGYVVADKLGALAVTTAKLAAKSVTTAKINDRAVTTEQLGLAAVETANIDDGAVTAAKISATLSPGSGQLAYVSRPTRTAWDKFIQAHMAGYSDWDVSGIVGSDAVKVKLWVTVGDQVLDSRIDFRKNGDTNWNYGQTHPAYAHGLNGESYFYEIECELDASQILEYRVYCGDGAALNAGAWLIIGWWEPITVTPT